MVDSTALRAWIDRLKRAVQVAAAAARGLGLVGFAAAIVIVVIVWAEAPAGDEPRVGWTVIAGLAMVPGLFLLWWQRGARRVAELPTTIRASYERTGVDVRGTDDRLPPGRIAQVIILGWRARRVLMQLRGAVEVGPLLRTVSPWVLVGLALAVPGTVFVVIAAGVATLAWLVL